MSPEQVNAEKLDKLTDIYSLGVMLFQMAVGKAPYSAQTNTFKIQLSIVSDPLPDAKEIYPPISDDLVAIIDRATQKKKEDRLFQMAVGQAPYSGQTNTFEIQLSIVSEPLPNAKDISRTNEKLDKQLEKAPYSAQTNTFKIQLSIVSDPLPDAFQSCDEFIKSFDKKVVSKKNKSKPINSKNNPLEVSKKTVNKKNNKTKSSLIVYLIVGIFLTAVIAFFIEQNRVQEKLKEEKLDMLVQERLDKIEDERLAKLEKERLAKLEKERLAKLEKERLAKLEKERLSKLRVNRANNNGSTNSNNRFNANSINTKEYSNGSYTGQIKNDTENGYGTFRWDNGEVYEGYWVIGERSGKGKYTFKSGDIYEGDFINNNRTGKGKYTWKENRDIYEGDFVDGVRTGKGKYTWKESGDIYEGDFINAAKSGKGKYTWKESGDIYEGDFINNVRTGKGKYTWKESGDIYEGDFINAAKSGKGKYTYKILGDVYEGDFVDLDFTGKGKYTWRNGDVFVGDFNKDVKGKGRMYFKSSGKREFGEYNKRGKWKKR
jgi:hypothetical protein